MEETVAFGRQLGGNALGHLPGVTGSARLPISCAEPGSETMRQHVMYPLPRLFPLLPMRLLHPGEESSHDSRSLCFLCAVQLTQVAR